MKLEDQVCSLELSKKLKELGVKQESYFYFVKSKISDPNIWSSEELEAHNHSTDLPEGYELKIICSAFTVAELGEMLPHDCYTQKEYPDSVKEGSPKWFCYLDSPGTIFPLAETEADARSKMLIYLIEKGLYKP